MHWPWQCCKGTARKAAACMAVTMRSSCDLHDGRACMQLDQQLRRFPLVRGGIASLSRVSSDDSLVTRCLFVTVTLADVCGAYLSIEWLPASSVVSNMRTGVLSISTCVALARGCGLDLRGSISDAVPQPGCAASPNVDLMSEQTQLRTCSAYYLLMFSRTKA